ncbi:50S ribosomal protein L37ae [Candidatus Pacearchaeota archaeon]|nr:50S ribosomal protein L37ae [Candidatus Pacearchaeota archaeon]
MGSKTKKIKAAGRFSGGIGTRARKNFNKIEELQRQRQVSPFYAKAKVKRIAAGIWKCMKTGKVFAGPAYYLEANK